jgi:hypothetical protein
VRWRDTFAIRLELLLNEEFDQPIEVLNLGHSMWGTLDEINFLARRARHYELDLVLLIYVLNDADYAGDLDLHNQFRSIYEPTGFVRHSYLLSFVQVSLGREFYGQLYLRSLLKRSLSRSDDWDRSLRLLGKGRNIAHSMGADFALVIFPFMYKLDSDYPFAEIHDLVRSYAETLQIPVLDLLPSLSGHRYTDLWVHPSDPHPNHRAHSIVSHAMAEFILAEELLHPDESAQRGLVSP